MIITTWLLNINFVPHFDLTYGNSNYLNPGLEIIIQKFQSKKVEDYDHHVECFP